MTFRLLTVLSPPTFSGLFVDNDESIYYAFLVTMLLMNSLVYKVQIRNSVIKYLGTLQKKD